MALAIEEYHVLVGVRQKAFVREPEGSIHSSHRRLQNIFLQLHTVPGNIVDLKFVSVVHSARNTVRDTEEQEYSEGKVMCSFPSFPPKYSKFS